MMLIPIKKISLWGGVLLVAGMLLFTGCTPVKTATQEGGKTESIVVINPETTAAAQKVLKFYQAVNLDMPRSQLESLLGVTGEVQSDGRVAYQDPQSDYGVLIKYGEDDMVFAKQLLFSEKSPELVALNPFLVTDKQAYRMAAGMPFYEVQDVMGSDGIEISLSKPETGTTKQVIGLGWFNSDGSKAIVYLNLPKGEVISSEFLTSES
ncbi:hypothetical protein [Acetobacterium carbinolicum]|uniref:hypothetical protein n=1 Tax=Acetobacterium carbinolicum TaxID=52690 RepID=UPI0039C91850